tara:strand:- start:314 stop:619 length:306 start_codon:yes stop_codon:yes gene_type:complete
MVPGEFFCLNGKIIINEALEPVKVLVSNSGDRPIQIGSHYHFAEVNSALIFDRVSARGLRLNIIAGTAVRFEPGQTKEVYLVPFGGDRKVYGFNQAVMGDI